MKPKKSEAAFTQENLLRAATARIHKEIARNRDAQNETVPPGWFNSQELAVAMKLSPCSIARTMLKVKAPQKKFRRWMGQSVRSVTYWKP